MILLTLSAALPSLKPAPCPSDSTLPCPSATTSQLAVLYLGLYLIALGNGGIKPNVSSLGADQFDESYEKERKHMSSFFNWYYFIISIGSLLSVTVFVYIQVRTYFCPSKLQIWVIGNYLAENIHFFSSHQFIGVSCPVFSYRKPESVWNYAVRELHCLWYLVQFTIGRLCHAVSFYLECKFLPTKLFLYYSRVYPLV